MRIEDYGFGRIRVDGKEYTSDLLLMPPRVVSPWWRRSGHRLETEDLREVLAWSPEVLVIGTGSVGMLSVQVETMKAAEERGIRVEILRTGPAGKRFNRLAAEGKKVAAALHLTC